MNINTRKEVTINHIDTVTKGRDIPRTYRRAAAAPRLPTNTVIQGNAVEVLTTLPDGSVDCVVSSPPYHLLRRYGAGPAEIGIEVHVDSYVDHLVQVCDELARVLAPHGTVWLNLGDSFSRGPRYGAPPKSLLLAPERLLLKLVERGWIVRNRIVWAKPNPMPSSVADRFSTSWENVFMLVRSRSYHFDLDAVREPHKSGRRSSRVVHSKYGSSDRAWAGPLAGSQSGLDRARAEGRPGHPLGKNGGDVWTIATARFEGAHFAVFPEELVRRPILAGCPQRVCTTCGTPWRRERRRDRLGEVTPACLCGEQTWRRGRVLDPFAGSGTVPVVADRLGRDWLGIELHPAFAAMARSRVAAARRART